jgi:hypothetical protein
MSSIREATIVEGENFIAKLVYRGPGDVVLVLRIDEEEAGFVPFDNLIKAQVRLDPDHASGPEKQIQELRREAAEAKAQVYDMEALRMQARDANEARRMAERERDDALADLRKGRKRGTGRDMVSRARRAWKELRGGR